MVRIEDVLFILVVALPYAAWWGLTLYGIYLGEPVPPAPDEDEGKGGEEE